MFKVLSSVFPICDVNPLLLLPPSVGPGGERRLSAAALLHEQNLAASPLQEKRWDGRPAIEKRHLPKHGASKPNTTLLWII